MIKPQLYASAVFNSKNIGMEVNKLKTDIAAKTNPTIINV